MADGTKPRNLNRQSLTASTFVEIVGTLVEDFDVIDVLTRLTSHCVELLGAAAAGILLADGDGNLRVIGASSEQIELLELFQIQNHQGPCLDCYKSGKVVEHASLDSNSPWPQFATESVRVGFPSVCAVPLRLNSVTLGCLNLFMAEPVASAADIALAQALADVASIAIVHHRSTRPAGISDNHLHHALTSRIAIEQAKGMIAAHIEGDMHAAFARLRTFAGDHHRGLTDVAEALVAGTLAVDSLTRTNDPPPTHGNPDYSTLASDRSTPEGDEVIHLRGELDMASSTALFDACLATGHVTLVVDLSAVTFMDCSAYSAFVAARVELEQRGGSLTLRDPLGQPAHILALITHLDREESLPAPRRRSHFVEGTESHRTPT